MTASVRVACCQTAPLIGQVEANRARCCAAVTAAAARGAQVVILPELAVSGYVFSDEAEARALAEPAGGPTAREWAQLSGELGITLIGGLCEAGRDGRLYNSAVVAADGAIAAVYRKAHLWDAEKLIFTPGSDDPPLIEAAGARISVMICYDLEFPEWTRLPALAGAQLLAVPANWPVMPGPEHPGERPMEVVRAQAAAGINRMFVAVCDRTGTERGVDWVGSSVICDPDGWPLAGPAPADAEATVIAACDLAAADDKRVSARNDVLADRRPQLYGRLVAPELTEGATR
jgi:predicted amidohydrolase